MNWRPVIAIVVNGVLVGTGLIAAGDADGQYRDAASRDGVIRDWMLQDYMSVTLPAELEAEKQQWRDEHIESPESKPDAPVLKHLTCFVSKEDSVVEQRMVQHVLDELTQDQKSLQEATQQLVTAHVPGSDPRWKDLYLRACECRRAQRLQPLLERWQRFVFNQHHHVPRTWKYTEALSCAQTKRFFAPGSTLNVLEMRAAYGKVRTLFDDPDGMLRNPDVSFDGKRLLFAWKKSDRKDDYHLYEMDLTTGKVRQLTFGLGVADYEGVYLPDGNIMFSSTRCIQTVDCNWTEVSNLYLMDQEGRYMRRIGFDQVHTIFPTATDDGRVLYTRWDYNDRGQIFPQPLFQMNMDGTNQREFYGGNSWFPTNIIHARQIPGTDNVLAIVTGHHTPAHGKLAIIDPARGRQEGQGVQLIAPIRQTDAIRVDKYGLGGNQFQYPYPLDEQRFLVTLALPSFEGLLGQFNIYFMDQAGRRELLVEGNESGDGIGCKQIVPLARRTAQRARPTIADYRKTSGIVYLQNVYEGAGLTGIPRGTIKRLRVVALNYRATGIGRTKQTGPLMHSNVSTPIAIGNGSWDVKTVLGTAKVYEDGSACFRVPARTPIYFQALDEKDYVVQTMRSWATLMPGENLSCVGCHEHKNRTPRVQPDTSLAMAAGVQELERADEVACGFSYPREIQPILDRHCVRCHAEGQDTPCLSGETLTIPSMKRELSKSYLALTHTKGTNGDYNHPLVNWINSMSGPALLPPYYKGAATSRLMTLLEQNHEGVQLTQEEMSKLACWIDLLVPYCGDYREANTWTEQERAAYAHFAEKRNHYETEERANIEALIRFQQTGQPTPVQASDWFDVAATKTDVRPLAVSVQ